MAELSVAINKLKPGKSPGKDNIHTQSLSYTKVKEHLAGYAHSSQHSSRGPSYQGPGAELPS